MRLSAVFSGQQNPDLKAGYQCLYHPIAESRLPSKDI